MSVALGIDPGRLLDLDAEMFDAVERAAAARWTVVDELTATLVDLVQLQRRDFLAAYGAKRLPPFERVPRPTEDGFPTTPVLTAAAFALEYGPKGEPDA